MMIMRMLPGGYRSGPAGAELLTKLSDPTAELLPRHFKNAFLFTEEIIYFLHLQESHFRTIPSSAGPPQRRRYRDRNK